MIKHPIMKIGLDLDGVCAEFEQHFLQYLELPMHSPNHWDDNRFMDNYHRIADDRLFWLTMLPLFNPEDLEFIPEIYVTARTIPSEVSALWLEINGFPEAEVITVGREGKVDALQGRVDVFLDDAIHNYKDLNHHGINTVLVSRPQNAWYNAERRIGSVLEFQSKLKEVA